MVVSPLDWSKYRALSSLHLNVWQRQLLIGLLVALSGQLYLTLWAEGFRISAAVILFPTLLMILMRDSHHPGTGLVTGVCVLGFRTVIDLAGGMTLLQALTMEYPGGIFYLCYDALLCLLVRDRRSVPPLRLWVSLWLCDLISNIINLFLSSHMQPQGLASPNLLSLAGLALFRSLAAWAIVWGIRGYRQLLIREEHERRYRRLFLMTASLKTELYFLKKDAEDIEGVMSNAYRLYERLEEEGDELSDGQSVAEQLAYELIWRIVERDSQNADGDYLDGLTKEQLTGAFSPESDFYLDGDGNVVFFIQSGEIAGEIAGILHFPFAPAELLSAVKEL